MREWGRALAEQLAEWLSKAKKWTFWAPLIIGLLGGLVIGSSFGPTQNLATGWAGLVFGAIFGGLATAIFELGSKTIDQVVARRPLGKVFGPKAQNTATIYVAPLGRPLDSELRRLDRSRLPFAEMPRVIGTELVVGYCDTIALSFIYAALLKAGKPLSDIVINPNADLDRGKWGINFISIGAANARTNQSRLNYFTM
jgi:hypothetical protein